MKKIISAIVICILLTICGCVRQPSYPPYPIITFQSLSKTTVNLYPSQGGSTQDSILLTIGFTDGEGGIGPVPGTPDTATSIVPCTQHSYDASVINNPAYNVFWYEYHAPGISTDSCIDRIASAYVPDNSKYNSLSGTIQFYPYIACPPVGNTDTIIFSVFIKDRNGKISNRVRTPPIIVTCQ